MPGLFAGAAVAVSGYGTFEPWRPPLVGPSLLLITLGVWGALRAHEASRA